MIASTDSTGRAHARQVESLHAEPATGAGAGRNALAALVDSRVVALTDPASPAAEQFRMLRHRLERLSRLESRRVVAVTSSLRGEGKTTTAVNLALTLAQVPGRQVALLDLDLCRGQVHKVLGFQPRIGLADVLGGHAELNEVLWRFGDSGLHVLPAGRPPADGTALLYGPRAESVVNQLKSRFDMILLDLTSLLASADAMAALDWADAALLVVRAGQTSREVVELALDVVPAEKLVGCVLNDVRPHESAGLETALQVRRAPAAPARALLPAEDRPAAAALPALPAHA
jgi:capsular exopolysaccharide synthesis family protein